MFIEKIINGGTIAYPQVFFKLAVYSVTKVETDTLQARHELEFLYPNKTLFVLSIIILPYGFFERP